MNTLLTAFRTIYLLFLLLLASAFELGAAIGVVNFLIPSLLMGLGVAIDVFIATVVKYRDRDLNWHTWTLPVTLTHVAFPAIGYFLFWNLATALPFAQFVLGIIGFILVALFVYETVSETAGHEPVFGISTWLGRMIGFAPEDSRRFIAILAVSWDALWSGPAKAAQATQGDWNSWQVVLSFIIAGVVVALIAEFALSIAKRLRKINFTDYRKLAHYNLIGKYLELSVISGFGILSLWHAFSPIADLYYSILMSAFILFITFLILRRDLAYTQLEEAKVATEQEQKT